MAKWVNSKVLDFGIDYIKQHCNKVVLVASYTAGDSYATVNGAAIADVTGLTSADFTIASSGNNRTLTAAAKTDTAANSSAGGAGNHIAYLDTTLSEVLWVVNDTNATVAVSGSPLNFAATVYTAAQPT